MSLLSALGNISTVPRTSSSVRRARALAHARASLWQCGRGESSESAMYARIIYKAIKIGLHAPLSPSIFRGHMYDTLPPMTWQPIYDVATHDSMAWRPIHAMSSPATSSLATSSMPCHPHGGQGESLVPPHTRGSVSLSMSRHPFHVPMYMAPSYGPPTAP